MDVELLEIRDFLAGYLAGRIRKADTPADLVRASAELPEFQVRMHAAGASPRQIGQAVSSINDAITIRLIELAQIALGPAPIPQL